MPDNKRLVAFIVYLYAYSQIARIRDLLYLEEKLFHEIGSVGVLGILSGESSVTLWVTLAQMIGNEGLSLLKKQVVEFERVKRFFLNNLLKFQSIVH